MVLAAIDSSTIVSFSEGDKEAYTNIYNFYNELVGRNILKMIHREDIAQDILQEVFLKLWENRRIIIDKEHLAAWLFRVSYNRSISYLRNAVKEEAGLNDHANILLAINEVSAENADPIQLKELLVREAIQQLPERKRQAIELCKLQGKTYAEAGLILGIAGTTVKEHASDAISFIKNYVQTNFSKSLLGSAIGIVITDILNW